MTSRFKRMLRAGSLGALWLLYASLPLLASVGQDDPYACCRAGGKHACFMRMHRATHGSVVGAFVKPCPASSTRSTSPRQSATSVAPLVAGADSLVREAPQAAALAAVGSSMTIRSPRAPPAAG